MTLGDRFKTCYGLTDAEYRRLCPIADDDLRNALRQWTALLRLFPSEAVIRHWLRSKNPRLRDATPLDFLQRRGLPAFSAFLAEAIAGGYG